MNSEHKLLAVCLLCATAAMTLIICVTIYNVRHP